jgi:hypothetical protein
MLPGRSGRSLGERAANSGVRPTAPASAPAPASASASASREMLPPACRAAHRDDGGAPSPAGAGGEGRHCWVRNPPDTPGIWPGLLVEWRQRDGVWQGRVAYTVTGTHGPALVETWLPAALLEPR